MAGRGLIRGSFLLTVRDSASGAAASPLRQAPRSPRRAAAIPLSRRPLRAVHAGPPPSAGAVEVPEKREEVLEQRDSGWIVTVYNNDENTYDEVIFILCIATECAEDEAVIEAWEIDHLGSSVVHHGAESACRRAAQIISTIGIRVEASPA